MTSDSNVTELEKVAASLNRFLKVGVHIYVGVKIGPKSKGIDLMVNRRVKAFNIRKTVNALYPKLECTYYCDKPKRTTQFEYATCFTCDVNAALNLNLECTDKAIKELMEKLK